MHLELGSKMRNILIERAAWREAVEKIGEAPFTWMPRRDAKMVYEFLVLRHWGSVVAERHGVSTKVLYSKVREQVEHTRRRAKELGLTLSA